MVRLVRWNFGLLFRASYIPQVWNLFSLIKNKNARPILNAIVSNSDFHGFNNCIVFADFPQFNMVDFHNFHKLLFIHLNRIHVPILKDSIHEHSFFFFEMSCKTGFNRKRLAYRRICNVVLGKFPQFPQFQWFSTISTISTISGPAPHTDRPGSKMMT